MQQLIWHAQMNFRTGASAVREAVSPTGSVIANRSPQRHMAAQFALRRRIAMELVLIGINQPILAQLII
jgi:hypothetical protein